MDFTLEAYENLLDLLKEKNYTFSNYIDYKNYEKTVIFRHDVDFSLEKALEFARLENSKNVKSTYFVLLSTDFYNVFSKNSFEILKEIIDLGHEIGLHFDEKRYKISDINSLEFYINKECKILGELLDKEVKVVSMHRPSKWILENNVKFKNIIDSYSKEFFKNFKYLSDSRMFWREDVLNIIRKESYNKLHILTHPFWYSNKNETLKEKLISFIKNSKFERYNHLKENFRELEKVIKEVEIYETN